MILAKQFLLRRLIHDRTLMIVSSGHIRYVTFRVRTQLMCMLGCLAVVALIAQVATRQQPEALFVEGISSTATADTEAPAQNADLDDLKDYNQHLQMRLGYLERKVEHLQQQNTHLDSVLGEVQSITQNRIQGLSKVLRSTGLDLTRLRVDPSTLADLAPAAGAQAMGGPYIPVVTPSQTALTDVHTLMHLQSLSERLPLRYPMKHATRTSTFGKRLDPFNGRWSMHEGADLVAPSGSRVYASAGGTVVFAGRVSAYGNVVEIDHGFGIHTRYAHLKRIVASRGSYVHQGEPIGVEGSTGRSTGTHLHYEVRLNGRAVSPERFLRATALAERLE